MCSTSLWNKTPHRDELYIDPVSESGKQGRFLPPEEEAALNVILQEESLEPENKPDDELDAFLALVQHDGSYRVEEVLKETSYEITQRVSRLGDTNQGFLIRKYINTETGLGGVYETLYNAQQTGTRFRYLPQILECYHLRDQLVVVMEFIQGETLQEVVYRSDPSTELACDVFPRVCAAVEELHEDFHPSIIHRDLKPANIILGWNRLTLIDFGIARVYRPGMMADTAHFGTREYAPPEQFGYGQTDVRSDVYALGMLLYYCLTEENAGLEARQTKFVDVRIPESFRRVIEKATAFDPQDRYESVKSLRLAFEEAAAWVCRQSEILAPSPERQPCPKDQTISDQGSINLTSAYNEKQNPVSTGMYEQSQTAGSMSGAPGKPTLLTADSHTMRDSFAKLSVFLANKIPAKLGRTWNILVVLSWAVLMAACISLVFDPILPADINAPLWYRAFEYGGIFGIFMTATAYVMLDRRRLRKRFSWLQRIPIWVEYVAYVVLVALLFGLYSIVYLVAVNGS